MNSKQNISISALNILNKPCPEFSQNVVLNVSSNDLKSCGKHILLGIASLLVSKSKSYRFPAPTAESPEDEWVDSSDDEGKQKLSELIRQGHEEAIRWFIRD